MSCDHGGEYRLHSDRPPRHGHGLARINRPKRFFGPRRLICLALGWGLFGFCFPAWCDQANVFVYHRFGEARHPSTNISTAIFEKQLEYIEREDYTVLTLGEVVRRLRSDEALPGKCVVLTVDDGYSSFWDEARPILRKYGFPATLFVSTQAIGKPGYMSWKELRELVREGFEIGNHSVSHPYLVNRREGETDRQWKARVRSEIRDAQATLTSELGQEPFLFAYPFGEYSPFIVEEVRAAGFGGAAGQQSGVVDSNSGLYLLPRFPMGGPYGTLEGFVDKLAMKALPVEVVSPDSPLVTDRNPPVLAIRLRSGEVNPGTLRLFVNGTPEGNAISGPDGKGVFRVQGSSRLTGRRSKYTLTAQGLDGQSWYWFSQLWINAGVPER